MKIIEKVNRYSADFDRVSVGLLQAGYALQFTAQGISVNPLMREGDFVLIEPTVSQLPKLSEIVFYINTQGNSVLDRVLKSLKKDDKVSYLLEGDQVANPDGLYEHTKVIGRLTTIEREGSMRSIEKPAFKALDWLAFLRSRSGLGSRGKLDVLLIGSKLFSSIKLNSGK